MGPTVSSFRVHCFSFVLLVIRLGFSKVFQAVISQDILAFHPPILLLDMRLLSIKDSCNGVHSSSSIFLAPSSSFSSGLPHCFSCAISLIATSGFLLSYLERLSVRAYRESQYTAHWVTSDTDKMQKERREPSWRKDERVSWELLASAWGSVIQEVTHVLPTYHPTSMTLRGIPLPSFWSPDEQWVWTQVKCSVR